MKRAAILIAGIFIVVLASAFIVLRPGSEPEDEQPTDVPQQGSFPSSSLSSPEVDTTPSPTAVASPASNLGLPIAEFTSRITKKPFGIHITRQNSPVQPERFSGYHTGADVEYGDVPGDVLVVAMADGEVVTSRTASGYGGVVAIRHTHAGKTMVAVYGHLDPKSMAQNGSQVRQGQQVGILGDDQSNETDGERKHLHFAVHKGSAVDIRGYVQSEAELNDWINPNELFAQ